MRIALDVSAVPDRPVGAGVYTIALARALAVHPDIVLALVSREDHAERWHGIAGGAEVHALAPRSRPARVAWEHLQGARAAARLDADVWHGPHYTMPARLTTPAVVTIHDLTFFDSPETHERVKVAWFRTAIRTSARRAARLVCVSDHTAARLDALVPGHAPVTVALLGVDHERFRVTGTGAAGDADLALLAAHGVTPPYIAFVGTAEPRKNLPALVEAFARISADRPDLRLVLAGGDGWGVAALRAAITAHRVATRVVRPGYLSDEAVAALYRRAEVVAYPSLAEGFGLPALEAMACGAPLVTARGTAMDEIVDDAAVQVDPLDVAAIADGLRAALDPTAAARMRAAGPRAAAGSTWERCAQAHVDAYRLALGGVAA